MEPYRWFDRQWKAWLQYDHIVEWCAETGKPWNHYPSPINSETMKLIDMDPEHFDYLVRQASERSDA